MALPNGDLITTVFDPQMAYPVDKRMQVDTLNSRDSISMYIRWEGMTVYVLEDSKIYILQGGRSNEFWKELGTGSGTGGTTFVGQFATADLLPTSGRSAGDYAFVGTGEDFVQYNWDNIANEWVMAEGQTDMASEFFHIGYKTPLRRPVIFPLFPKDVLVETSGDFVFAPETAVARFIFVGEVEAIRGIETAAADREIKLVNRTGSDIPLRDKASGIPSGSGMDFGGTDYTWVNGSEITLKGNGTYWQLAPNNSIAFSDHLDSVNAEVSIGSDGLEVITGVFDTLSQEYVNYKEITYVPETLDGVVYVIRNGKYLQRDLSNGLNVKSYSGVDDTGLADSSTSFQQIFNLDLPIPVIRIPKGTYRATSGINVTKGDRTFSFEPGSKIIYDTPSSSPFLKISGSTGDEQLMASNLNKGSKTITLQAPIAGLVADDWIQITSDEIYSANARSFDTKREFSKVVSVLGTSITLLSPAILDYKTSFSAKVKKVNLLPSVMVEGLTLDGVGDNLNRGIQLEWCIGSTIRDSNINNIGNTGIDITHSVFTVASNNKAKINYTDSLQYGLIVFGSQHCVVNANTISSERTSIDITRISHYVTVNSNSVTGSINTHTCDSVVINANTVVDGGLRLRGGNIIASNNIVNTDTECLSMEEAAEVGNIKVFGNFFRGELALQIRGSNVDLSDNVFEVTSFRNINSVNSLIVITSTEKLDNFTLKNNTIKYIGAGIPDRCFSIVSGFGSNYKFINNTISGTKTPLHLGRTNIATRENLVIENNTLYSEGDYGVVFNKWDGTRISGNIIIGASKLSSGIWSYGSPLDVSSFGTIITDNIVKNATRAIDLNGDSGYEFNNVISRNNVGILVDLPDRFNRVNLSNSIVGEIDPSTFVRNNGFSHTITDGVNLTGNAIEGSLTTVSIRDSSGISVGFPSNNGTVFTFGGSAFNRTWSLWKSTTSDGIWVQYYNATGVGQGWFRIDSINATTTIRGIIELATQTEVNTGTDNERAVTPLTFQTRLSSWAVSKIGARLLESDGSTLSGSAVESAITSTSVVDDTGLSSGFPSLNGTAITFNGSTYIRTWSIWKSVTSSGLWTQYYDTLGVGQGWTRVDSSATIPNASTTQRGIIEQATDAETITGTDTERAVSPSNLQAKLNSIILSSTATLDFPVIAAGETERLTTTVTGADLLDPVLVAGPDNIYNSNNSTIDAWVSAANTVTVRVRNNGASSIDPGEGQFKIKVFK